jgi:hypothetical protein
VAARACLRWGAEPAAAGAPGADGGIYADGKAPWCFVRPNCLGAGIFYDASADQMDGSEDLQAGAAGGAGNATANAHAGLASASWL